MDDAGVRTSVAEYEKNMQLRVRRPLTQWVSALEGVRVSEYWCSCPPDLLCCASFLLCCRLCSVTSLLQICSTSSNPCVSCPHLNKGRVPELDRLRTRLEQRTRKVKAEGACLFSYL